MANPLEDALIENEVAQQLAESDDPKIRAAMKLLSKDDRPSVPVYTYDDPEKLYEEVLKKWGDGLKPSPNNVAITLPDRSAIYVNKKSKDYNTSTPYVLASKLAHEQVHVMQPSSDPDEVPAWDREARFVQAHPAWFDPGYRTAVANKYVEMKKLREAKRAEIQRLLKQGK